MYWPTEQSEAKQFGDIVVEMQSCSTINTYEFRIFKMTLVGLTLSNDIVAVSMWMLE